MRTTTRIVLLSFAVTGALAGADDGMLARMEAACKQRGGHIEHSANGSLVCVGPSSSGGSAGVTTSANPYEPMVNEILKLLFSPNNNAKAAKQRNDAMMRELQAQREQARRNQQQAEASRLDAILTRLTGAGDMTLKGMNDNTQLRLKLGKKRPLGMEVYQHPDDGKKRMGISGLSGINLDNDTPSTTKAQLTLKTGEDAMRSLRPPQVAVPSASGGGNEAAAAETTARSQLDEVASAIRQLTPAEQQKLLAALRAGPAEDVSGMSPAKSDSELSLKLSEAQSKSDALKAAADSGAAPEELSKKASDQFQNLQQMNARNGASVPAVAQAPDVGNAGGPPPDSSAVHPSVVSSPGPDCSNSGGTESSVVDLRCAKQPLAIDPAKVQPDEAGLGSGKVQAPTAADLNLLFFENSRWPGPRRPDAPFRNPLRDEEMSQIEAQLAKRNAQQDAALFSAVVMGPEVSAQHRERLATIFLTPANRGRYELDQGYRNMVDEEVDKTVKEVKRSWAKDDLEAFRKAGQEIAPALRQWYPNGLPKDGKFSSGFSAERDRVRAVLDQRMAQNTEAAPVQLLIRLDLAFMGINK